MFVLPSAFIAPQTEGIKYAGSKLKLLSPILQLIQSVSPKTVLDGFSGTTRVSQALAQQGVAVVANDISVWSQTLGECYLLAKQQPKYYQSLIAHLNATPAVDGWFTKHYGGDANNGEATQKDGLKKPWQTHNTQKLDGIRLEIENLSLNKIDKAVALTSLMLALDKVDNSIGHFVSYLNRWAVRSYLPLQLKTPNIISSVAQHKVTRGDVFAIAPKTKVDLAYYDPPYGSGNAKMPPSRIRYAAYYHLWTTVCLFDSPPLFGKAKRRTDTSDSIAASEFEEFRKDENGDFIAIRTVEKLIQTTAADKILLSYSPGNPTADKELNSVLLRNGKLIKTVAIDYKKNVMADMIRGGEWQKEAKPHREFLFLLQK